MIYNKLFTNSSNVRQLELISYSHTSTSSAVSANLPYMGGSSLGASGIVGRYMYHFEPYGPTYSRGGIWRFDIPTKIWSKRRGAAFGYNQTDMVNLDDNRLIIYCGADGSFARYSLAIYNISGNTISNNTKFPGISESSLHHVAGRLSDGMIYIAGIGFNDSVNYIHRITAQATLQTINRPMPIPTIRSDGLGVGDELYVIGGRVPSEGYGSIDKMQIYNRRSNSWTIVDTPFKTTNPGNATCFYHNGRIFYHGYTTSSGDRSDSFLVRYYDISTKRWHVYGSIPKSFDRAYTGVYGNKAYIISNAYRDHDYKLHADNTIYELDLSR